MLQLRWIDSFTNLFLTILSKILSLFFFLFIYLDKQKKLVNNACIYGFATATANPIFAASDAWQNDLVFLCGFLFVNSLVIALSQTIYNWYDKVDNHRNDKVFK